MFRLTIILITFALISGGCMTLKQPNMKIDYYTLEYDAPRLTENSDLNPVPAVLMIERFSVAPDYNTSRIIYRDQEYKRSSYFYHKWKAHPADMITYFLNRDIGQSGLFEAVVTSGSKTPHTHVVEGMVDEILEWDSRDEWEAVLSVNVTLLESGGSNNGNETLFQKRFSARKKCTEKRPKALAQAMSLAMADVSEQICIAIHKAIEGNKGK